MPRQDQNTPSPAVAKPTLAIVLLVIVLAVGAVAAVLLMGDPSPSKNDLPAAFDYDIGKYLAVDPKLVGYRQTAMFPFEMQTLRAVATGPDDAIYVVGDESIVVRDAEGMLIYRNNFDKSPRALAVDTDGSIFLAFENHIRVYDSRGQPSASWAPLGPRALLTSIALGENDVFVADAGNRCVLRYDRSGKMIQKLAQADPARDVPALSIPSAYFDVALGTDGLLRVVNPGKRRIEFFTPDGLYEAPLAWGQSGMELKRFCGCCNPVAIALLADNRVVTAEKSIPRVKVYSADGRFECVVATPEQLGATESAAEEIREQHKLLAVDLATDSQGRVLVLDPAAKVVRVFVSKPRMDANERK